MLNNNKNFLVAIYAIENYYKIVSINLRWIGLRLEKILEHIY